MKKLLFLTFVALYVFSISCEGKFKNTPPPPLREIVVLPLSVDTSKPFNFNEFAKSFNKDNVILGENELQCKLPEGVAIKVLGTTYEQLIGFDGSVHRPLTDIPKKVLVTFELSKDSKKAQSATLEFDIPGTVVATSGTNAKPKVIPALQEWQGRSNVLTDFTLKNIAIDVSEKNRKAFEDKAQIYRDDLANAYTLKAKEGMQKIDLNFVDVPDANNKFDARLGTLCFTDKPFRANLGKEGYAIDIYPGITYVYAEDPIGAFWATRTLLQMAATRQANIFPCGTIVDYPKYPIRGMLYDAGRKKVPMEQLDNIMKTMAYYKMNNLHVCLNNNFIWAHQYTQIPDGKKATAEQKRKACEEVLKKAPTFFNLESKMVGANGVALNDSRYFYTKEAFGNFIDQSKRYGVEIVPEIDVPGHAMSFVSVRPDLMYQGEVHKEHDVERTAMLDASDKPYPGKPGRTYRDETVEFIQTVFDEYLLPQGDKPPVFRNTVFHIGTDEYYGNAEEYRAFADSMLRYVKSRGFTPRFWGSLTAKKGKTPVVSEGVQMCIWSNGWNTPQPAIDAGYDIINILDRNGYVVPSGNGSVGAYRDMFNQEFMYGPKWQSHIMAHNHVVPGHKQLLGSMWAIWFDNSFKGDPGLIDYDIYQRLIETNAVVAEKTWNDGTDMSFEDFKKVRDQIGTPHYIDPYHQNCQSFSLENPKQHSLNLGNVSPNYVAEFTVERLDPSNNEQVLFSSWTGAFKIVQKETHRVGITRDFTDYSFDYTMPVNKKVTFKLISKGRTLSLYADGVRIGGPVRNEFPKGCQYHSFLFPLDYIGTPNKPFTGKIYNLKIEKLIPRPLTDIVDAKEITAKASSEQGEGTDGDASKIIDSKPNTHWHSRYKPQRDKPPFELTFKFAKPYSLNAVSILPRQDNQVNGNIISAEIYVKANSAWKKVATYEGNASETMLQTVNFAPTGPTQEVKIKIINAEGNFGAMAECYFHKSK